MASTASNVHFFPVGADEPEEVVAQLQAALLELIDLSPDWQAAAMASGRPVVSALAPATRRASRVLTRARRHVPLAERAVTLGYWRDGQARAVAVGSGLASDERDAVEDQSVVGDLMQGLTSVKRKHSLWINEAFDVPNEGRWRSWATLRICRLTTPASANGTRST